MTLLDIRPTSTEDPTTVIPALVEAAPQPPAERPRSIRARPLEDKLNFAGAAVGSLALVWLLYTQVLPTSGSVGFVVCWYLTFAALYALVTSLDQEGPAIRDRLASALVHGAAALVAFGLFSAIVYVFARGAKGLGHANTFTKDGSGVGPLTPLTHGGALHAVIGTLIEIGIAVVLTLPLGVATAVYMVEIGGRFARIVRTLVEAMTALPSIVAGLFIYTLLIIKLGVPKTGFAGSMAISVMILPIIARASDVVLRVVPSGLREASLALGASRWQTVWKIVLPTARPGLATALILGIARGVGETSPVLLTSGASTFLNTNPFKDPMNSLPLYVFSLVRSGQTVLIDRAFAAAAILLALVLAMFVAARFLARQRTGR